MRKTYVLQLIILLGFMACEKDDICNEGTPGTPRLIVRLFDKDNPTEFKSADGFIQEVNSETPLLKFNGDSLYFPYNTSKNYTRYAFVIFSQSNDTLIDTLQFNYHSRKDTYLRRACGIIAEFTIADDPITPINTPSWYARSATLTQTLKNEEQAHLVIFH